MGTGIMLSACFSLLIQLTIGNSSYPENNAFAATDSSVTQYDYKSFQLSLVKMNVSDPDHSKMSLEEIKAENPIAPFNIGVTFKNNIPEEATDGRQSFTLVMEARDKDDVTIAIETLNQILPDLDGEEAATIEWDATLSGKYDLRLMAITGLDNSQILSSIVQKEIIIVGNSHCDQSLWKHVYNPQRLQIVHECVAVVGIASFISENENDGDKHVGIRPDPENAHLVNEENQKHHNGAILGEAICYNPPEKLAPKESCENYENAVIIPPRYSYILMTGSYVLDKQHNLWGEIHPITSIVVIGEE